MARIRTTVQLDGMREFNRRVGRALDRDVPKRMGRAHREVGQFVIRRLQPRPTVDAVGRGRGATVRPSATRREVLLRVGGKHRAGRARDGKPRSPRFQWGVRQNDPANAPTDGRPDILATARQYEPELKRFYAEAVVRAMGDARAFIPGKIRRKL